MQEEARKLEKTMSGHHHDAATAAAAGAATAIMHGCGQAQHKISFES